MLPHQFFKLLSDETRVRCLMLVAREGETCVGDLAFALQESQRKFLVILLSYDPVASWWINAKDNGCITSYHSNYQVGCES